MNFFKEALMTTNLAMSEVIDAEGVVEQCKADVENIDNIAIWEFVTGEASLFIAFF